MSTKDLVPFYDLHLWTFERLGETVQLCNVYWPLEDFDKTDEIVTQLYLIIDEVEVLIPILRDERSPDLNTLIELHAALFQLLALWEAKLATLDGRVTCTSSCEPPRTWSGPGRRRKYINVELLELLREMKLSCADALLVSRSTLWRHLKELKVMPTFSDITDADLDAVVEAIQHSSPRSGAVMVWGELKSYGVSVSRRRVRESLVRVNPTGVELRASTSVIRRAYSVPCSNALWHIDGLHCLIREDCYPRWHRRILKAGCLPCETDLFCLHYVFIPRINAQLKTFAQAWNNHPMCTGQGLSPMQMWMRGLIVSHIQEPVSDDYRVDEGHSANPFDE
ncbi:hypothetical protein EMCRGX_G000321 [Ephydatia muelleri]